MQEQAEAAAATPTRTPLYPRVLLKISGEALMGDQGFGLHPPTVTRIADEVRKAHAEGIQICMVIGGGNIFRGLVGAAQGMERSQADYMGMLATVMNALGMQSALEAMGVHTRVQSAIPMSTVCEPYLYPAPSDPAPREGPGGDLCRGDGQSLLHDRHGGDAAGDGDELRRHIQRHPG